MAFKFGPETSVALDSPERMFQDFNERTLKGLLTYQGKILADYQAEALQNPNIALKLPTGSGKTLVGLLIGDWRRRKNDERVVYLCPTNQLVNQVVHEAHSKYGMRGSVHGFTGSNKDYDPAAKARYQSGELVAVTSYAALFNRRPFFSDPHVVILDDAHAAENYLMSYWTLSVARDEDAQRPLFQALMGVLQSVLSEHDLSRLTSMAQSLWDYYWVEKIPSERLMGIAPQLTAVFDAHVEGTDLRYQWSVLRDHLLGCHLYVGNREITLRPLLPPSLRHSAFSHARQRIYMSATLGEGGDLERLTGTKNIHRLEVKDLNTHGVGRRFFIFPGRSLTDQEQTTVLKSAIQTVPRAVILVPDFRAAKKVAETVCKPIGYKTFSAVEIEASKATFVGANKAVAVMANRYDGIDFPDEDCRLLIVSGLPAATNLQERFLLSRMGARLLLNDRIRTRVVQAVGRCTRSTTDFSAVIVVGEDLLTYLSKSENQRFLHPELQAEIKFGITQSSTAKDMLENLSLFYARGDDWQQAENQIRKLRGEATPYALPSLGELAASASHEIDYQYAMWDGNAAGALEAARKALTELKDPDLRGYRALWNYLAGSAAAALSRGAPAQATVARDYYAKAAGGVPSVGWLRELGAIVAEQDEAVGSSAAPLIDRLEVILDDLGTMHDEKFAAYEKAILEGVAANESTAFEEGQRCLGTLLGFESGNDNGQASPDPWWLVSEDLCLVFEDHSDGHKDTLLSVKKARQVASHPNWIRERRKLKESAKIVPILVTPSENAEPEAAIHLKGVVVWPLDEFREWTAKAVRCVRQLRVGFPGAGDILWRQAAMEAYGKDGLDPKSLLANLRELDGTSSRLARP